MENMKTFLDGIPPWGMAVIVLAAGWLAATLLRTVVAELLNLLHFNQMCERTGTSDFLRKGEVAMLPSALVGRGFYWIIIIGVLLETARILNVGMVAEFRQRIVTAVPGFLSAVLVLVVGLIIMAFLSGFVRTIARNAGSPYANLWARSIRGIGVILVLALALEQAEIRGSVMAGVLYVVVAATAFGIALAFGLGCKDMARSAMERWIANLKERHRDASKPDLEG